MDVTIRGITFPGVDLTDADVVEAYADGIKDVQGLKAPKEGDVVGTASFIRELCEILRGWFDDILGDEAGNKILPRDSMYEGLAAYRELIEAQKQANKETHALWADLDMAAGATESDAHLSRQQKRARARQERRTRKKKQATPISVSEEESTDPYSPARLLP